MSWPDYKGKTIGFAKVMAELPVSDGSLAHLIYNYTATKEGFLSTRSVNMPLIPKAWNKDSEYNYSLAFENVYGMKFMEMNGESPELLILTAHGPLRFSPSFRAPGYQTPRGSDERYAYTEITLEDVSSGESHLFLAYTGEIGNGLKPQYLFRSRTVKDISIPLTGNNIHERTLVTVSPQSTPMFPAQMETVGNRIYFTYCDGGGAYVWDGNKIRQFGYNSPPSAPHVLGPASNRDLGDGGWANGGGFSDGGRIGTLNYDLTTVTDTGEAVTSGGIESGLWYYAVAFENEDGSYSETSIRSSRVTIEFHVSNPESGRSRWGLGFLRRRFWVNDIPRGPQGTVARILLRTANLTSLPSGDTGELRFLHRIPNNNATEYMDDIPDSELGRVWEDRRSAPPGFYFMKFFGGSMFVMRTEDHPSRVWWSEQGTVTGSIPESFMHNSWRDVFPETGPITGSYSSNINGKQTLLVFKETATHYVSDSYEQPGTSGWSFGSLSTVAGCAGPNLCQSTPDGYVLWYGNGTFWMWGKDTNGVIDVGSPIRNRLDLINKDRERFGVSWITKENKEVVFCLPYEDSTVPNLQFVWDYRNRGWRLRKDVRPTAVETFKGFTLIANKPEDSTPQWSPNILVYQRGHPAQPSYTQDTKSIYMTGWQSFSDFGPDFHSTHRTADSVFTMEERGNNIGRLYAFSDWETGADKPIDEQTGFTSVNFEELYFSNPESFTESSAWSSLNGYEEADYRNTRPFTHRVALDLPSNTVFSLAIIGSVEEDHCLISIDAYGPESSNPTSRSPAIGGEKEVTFGGGRMTHSSIRIVDE